MNKHPNPSSLPLNGSPAVTLVPRRAILVAVACFGLCAASRAEPLRLNSPDGRVRLTVSAERSKPSSLSYTVQFKGRQIVAPSRIRFAGRQNEVVGDNLTLQLVDGPSTHQESWTPVKGERSSIEDHHNELVLRLRDASGMRLTATFRCYDAGIGFKVALEPREGESRVYIDEELTEFNFLADHTAWVTTNAQGEYHATPLSRVGEDVERPLLLRTASGPYVALGEARLVDYAQLRFRRSANNPQGLVVQLAGPVEAEGRIETPWRYVMVGDSPGELVENNDLLRNLNDPCALADTSWIKPGKVLRDITLTTKGGLACVDFAVENNFQYVEFDAGWYGHEYDDTSDATTVTVDPKRSPGPLDLPGVIEYAEERGIGIILYVNRRALETQLEELLPLYRSWGVRGVKYGFVKTGSQEWTRWLHDAIRLAAANQLMVDVHDEYRPTGFSRTYPNLMTVEGVRGDEASPSSEQTLTSLFTRGIAGPSDFTVCYFTERVAAKWSHAQQLAKAVCFYSPWQFLFWYDTPLRGTEKETIEPMPEIAFFAETPTTWDETRVLHGSVGEYAVIARRTGGDWRLGAINSGTPRTLETPLDFLDPNQEYNATLYVDDENTPTKTGVAITRRRVTSRDSLSLDLRSNGGAAASFTPLPLQTAASVQGD